VGALVEALPPGVSTLAPSLTSSRLPNADSRGSVQLNRFDAVFRHIAPLLRVALLVAAGDLLTKQAAVLMLAGGETLYADWLRLTLVHNDAGVLGFSFGTYTFQVNLIVKSGAILLMLAASRDLARIDPDAPVALGFIVGGALGNLASLLIHPAGVVDFIAVSTGAGQELVLNGADIAAYTGLALLGRTAWRVVAAARSPASAVISARLAGRAIALRLVGDREIVRNVAVCADAKATERDDLWVPRQKPRVDHVVVTPLFDERPLGATREEERPRVPARVIDLRTWRATDRELRPEK
jgi:lipoprotein signal peptidase